MKVYEAQTPSIGGGVGDNFYALTTVQVGGDVVDGWGGVVTKSEDASQVVGKSVIDGVLSQISAKEGPWHSSDTLHERGKQPRERRS